ncbi:hypothetical protein B9T24_15820 [Acinetobacter sp. ANC 4654]|uniref:hypothetical protein n=1 Tax=Acinetobacter sp. ANC 4654 TaxID=1977872 RepID=UPI000A338712|nr:hypothetical protein [Acinetobacter sp. ANC 4654]OTG91776.1 hypothetical protein B9T24_15820 [Acinetobacter sp. ANC 4654]
MSNSYKPDFMLIKLNNDFSELPTEGIQNRFLLGVFFHEWIHYFHNVSTNFGMSAFTSTASLWLYFHNVNKNGKTLEHLEYKDSIKMFNSLLSHSREQVNSKQVRALINKNKFEDLEIIKVNLKKVKISEESYLHSLVCDIKLKNKTECIGSVEIRPIEIFENLAYLLEKKLVESLQKNDNSQSKFDTFDAPIIIPYRMVELLLNYYIQDLSEDDCIRIMLVSLQAMDSIELLIEIIKIVKCCKENNKSIEKCLIETSEKILKDNNLIKRLEEVEEWINEKFPVNDVIGKAIKSLFKIIKKNLILRYKNPFIEFDIIKLLEEKLKNFDEILKEYSCCALLIPLSYASIKDELVKSQLVVIGLSEYLEDWQQFHAAFHFIGLHIESDKDGGFKDTNELKNSCCPFFNVCAEEPKQKNISLCQNTPWKNYNADNPTVDVCWYANGVRQTIYCPD